MKAATILAYFEKRLRGKAARIELRDPGDRRFP